VLRWDDGDSCDRCSHGRPYHEGADYMEDSRNDDCGGGAHSTSHDRRGDGVARVVDAIHQCVCRREDHHNNKHQLILS
jgi:hypothetical protein